MFSSIFRLYESENACAPRRTHDAVVLRFLALFLGDRFLKRFFGSESHFFDSRFRGDFLFRGGFGFLRGFFRVFPRCSVIFCIERVQKIEKCKSVRVFVLLLSKFH